jgi:FixJ family two-component response regulator
VKSRNGHRDGKTVLLVDDDLAVRSSLAFNLRTEGYSVRAYATGRELLDDPDMPQQTCLVIDLRLPDIEGLKLIEQVRRRADNRALPAILITTNPSAAVRRRAEEAQVPIVEKPLITGTLFQRIHAAFP